MSETNRGDRVSGVNYTAMPSREEAMAAFDALPRNIRRVIADAPYNYDTFEIARQLAWRKPSRLELDLLLASQEYVENAYRDRGFDPKQLKKKRPRL